MSLLNQLTKPKKETSFSMAHQLLTASIKNRLNDAESFLQVFKEQPEDNRKQISQDILSILSIYLDEVKNYNAILENLDYLNEEEIINWLNASNNKAVYDYDFFVEEISLSLC